MVQSKVSVAFYVMGLLKSAISHITDCRIELIFGLLIIMQTFLVRPQILLWIFEFLYRRCTADQIISFDLLLSYHSVFLEIFPRFSLTCDLLDNSPNYLAIFQYSLVSIIFCKGWLPTYGKASSSKNCLTKTSES